MTSCIFCGSTSAQFTDEHVIPEFAGGSLIIRCVCKKCNDEMGSDFEGPVSKSPLFDLPRCLHDIQGKKKTPIIPFQGGGTTAEGHKISLDHDFQPHLKPAIKDTLSSTETLSFELAVDVTDQGKIPQIVESKIRRHARSNWPDKPKEGVDKLVEDAIASIPKEPTVKSERPVLLYKLKVDIVTLRLMYMKIAFEMGVHHHGAGYLKDPIAITLRDSIIQREKNHQLRGNYSLRPIRFHSW
jgi:hypothetical protein